MNLVPLTTAMSATILLAACAQGSPGAISMESQQKLQAEASIDLCNAYGFNHGAAVRVELTKRGAITPSDWRLIDARQVAIGMSGCAALASWGPPSGVSTTITAAKTLEVWAYLHCSTCKGASYLYLDNGHVKKIKS